MSVRRRILRQARRGFTLVELIVALSAGLAVAGAAYMLSKASLNAFEAEARLSQAQFGATMGLNRLVGDLQRAAFMSNPNAQSITSGHVCGGSTQGPYFIRSVLVDKGGGSLPGVGVTRVPNAAATYNVIAPDSIYITGNMSSDEQFEFSSIQGTTVYMTLHDGAMQRTMLANATGGLSVKSLFLPGRYVRLVDSTGEEGYAHVTVATCLGGSGNCDVPDFTTMTLTLDAAPFSNGMVCGDWISGGLINPVNIIQYWVGAPAAADHLAPAAAALLAPQASAQTGDANRTELIRTELTDVGAGSPQQLVALNPAGFYASDVVAEYAIDFNISATFRTGTAPDFTGLTHLDGDDSSVVSNFGSTAAESFVGMGVRLSVRARAPDRDAGIGTSPKSRYNVFGAPVPNAFARSDAPRRGQPAQLGRHPMVARRMTSAGVGSAATGVLPCSSSCWFCSRSPASPSLPLARPRWTSRLLVATDKVRRRASSRSLGFRSHSTSSGATRRPISARCKTQRL